MSGICGFYNLDGAGASPDDLAGMLALLERRGPDGTHHFVAETVALGHASLATTPEALIEYLPFAHRASGCVITADARLDYRDDLLEKLGLGSGERIGDGELILRSYLKWGTDCLSYFEGDFAFAIWDPREQRLFCARDIAGMRQLIFHHRQGVLFAFATEERALLRLRQIPRIINEGRIGDALENLEAIDLRQTFFVGLERLPPAHALIVQGGDMRIWKYWQMMPCDRQTLSGNAAYAEAFLDVFKGAVRSRLRSSSAVGSMLSGGMDSGSVSAVAASLLKESGAPQLKTFSAIGTRPDCVESRTIKSAFDIDHINPTTISLADLERYRSELETLSFCEDNPFDGHMALVRAVYLAAKQSGVKVVLDGVSGDTTLGADNMVLWHLRQGRILRAWREARGMERFWTFSVPPASKVMAKAARHILVPEWLRRARRSIRPLQPNAPDIHTLLSTEFAQRINMSARREVNAAHVAGFGWVKSEDRSRSMLHPYVVVGRERYDRTASALGIEPRDPFLDQRLLKFCMGLPADQLQDGGWPKIILRRATAGLLPDTVRWRIGKEHLGGDFSEALWAEKLASFNEAEIEIMQQYVADEFLKSAGISGAPTISVAHALTLNYTTAWIRHINSAPFLMEVV